MKDRTARHRTKISTPVERLVDARLILPAADGWNPPDVILDYGCGYGTDAYFLHADRWDPCYFPDRGPLKDEHYNVVLCTYVLNILPTKAERQAVLDDVCRLLHPILGWAYVTVRRDVKGWHRSWRGWQGNVQIPEGEWTARSLWKTGWYETYEITKTPVPASKRRKR